MKNDPIEGALAALEGVQPYTPEGRKHFAKALASKSNLVAAKAARIVAAGSVGSSQCGADAQCRDLTAELATAFDRFLARGSALDKGCAATLAIARALVSLDYGDAELFRRGMKHVQVEGTWGGSEDMAAELRGACAMGLANSRYPYKLRDLVELLADAEWRARSGAVKAMAAIGSESSSLLLRLKALLGDREPEVLSGCLIGLLDIDGADALPLAGSLARSRDPEVREAAILALGESRRNDAIDWLRQHFDEVADGETKKCILLSLASSRTEAAVDFLLELIRDGSAAAAELAFSAMSIHRDDPRLRDLIGKAMDSRAAR